MMYQMQNFINTMGDLCEFSFIDGVVNSLEPPIKFFVDRGITPPYKGWMNIRGEFRIRADGTQERDYDKTLPVFNDAIGSIYYLMEYLNR